MIQPHRDKYHPLYWGIAYDAASQSPSQKRQVGAVVVTPTGMLSVGWNAMPAGFENECEYVHYDAQHPKGRLKCKPETIHAERNAIDKMTNQGISVNGSVLYVTVAPCFECAKALHGLGLKAIYYDQPYKNDEGLQFLSRANIPVIRRQEQIPSQADPAPLRGFGGFFFRSTNVPYKQMLQYISAHLKSRCYVDIIYKTGISPATVYRWREHPPERPSRRVLCVLASYCGLTLSDDDIDALT